MPAPHDERHSTDNDSSAVAFENKLETSSVSSNATVGSQRSPLLKLDVSHAVPPTTPTSASPSLPTTSSKSFPSYMSTVTSDTARPHKRTRTDDDLSSGPLKVPRIDVSMDETCNAQSPKDTTHERRNAEETRGKYGENHPAYQYEREHASKKKVAMNYEELTQEVEGAQDEGQEAEAQTVGMSVPSTNAEVGLHSSAIGAKSLVGPLPILPPTVPPISRLLRSKLALQAPLPLRHAELELGDTRNKRPSIKRCLPRVQPYFGRESAPALQPRLAAASYPRNVQHDSFLLPSSGAASSTGYAIPQVTYPQPISGSTGQPHYQPPLHYQPQLQHQPPLRLQPPLQLQPRQYQLPPPMYGYWFRPAVSIPPTYTTVAPASMSYSSMAHLQQSPAAFHQHPATASFPQPTALHAMPIPDGAGSFYATYRGLSGSVASVSSGQPLYAEELSSLSIAQGLYALQQEQSDRPDPDALASAPQYGQLAPGNEVVQDQSFTLYVLKRADLRGQERARKLGRASSRWPEAPIVVYNDPARCRRPVDLMAVSPIVNGLLPFRIRIWDQFDLANHLSQMSQAWEMRTHTESRHALVTFSSGTRSLQPATRGWAADHLSITSIIGAAIPALSDCVVVRQPYSGSCDFDGEGTRTYLRPSRIPPLHAAARPSRGLCTHAAAWSNMYQMRKGGLNVFAEDVLQASSVHAFETFAGRTRRILLKPDGSDSSGSRYYVRSTGAMRRRLKQEGMNSVSEAHIKREGERMRIIGLELRKLRDGESDGSGIMLPKRFA
ncbi:predicted protein [Postia placenta Mad-698-R]|nr:predicted protein [Postia placenta Mad-698-R]